MSFSNRRHLASSRSLAFPLFVLALTEGALLGVTACRVDDTTSSGGSGGGAAQTVATVATTAASTADASSSSAGGCASPSTGECAVCMQGACCESLTACENDPDCAACVAGTDPDACERTPETHARVDAFLVCKGGSCAMPCIGAVTEECTDILDPYLAPECVACLETSCCEEVAGCHAVEGCWVDCFTEHDDAACHGDPDGHALYHAMGECVNTSCAAECAAPTISPACDAPSASPSLGACITIGGAVECNPVTNEGCAADGSACDTNANGFECYPPPNDVAICQPCGQNVGFCAPGHICAGGSCAKYCCNDGDCGTGTCDTAPLGSGSLVGICVAP